MRAALLSLALLSLAGAVWRAVVGVRHYEASLAVRDDPSHRELEEVSTYIEGGFSIVLLLHAAAFVALSRRGLLVHWTYVGSLALFCAVAVGGSLLGLPLLSAVGVYPLTMVIAVFALSHRLGWNWLSLYLGALVGGTIGYLVGVPSIDGFVWLSVVGPCVLLAFLGGGLRWLYQRIAARSASS